MGKEIKSSITRLHFKLGNEGNAAVDRADIRSDSRIEFAIKDGQVVGGYVAARGTGSPPSSLTIEKRGDLTINIFWDYIEPKDFHSLVFYVTGEFKKATLTGHYKYGVVIRNTQSTSAGLLFVSGFFAFLFMLPILGAGAAGLFLPYDWPSKAYPKFVKIIPQPVIWSAIGSAIITTIMVIIVVGSELYSKFVPTLRGMASKLQSKAATQ